MRKTRKPVGSKPMGSEAMLSFKGCCHYCGARVGHTGTLAGTLGGGAPMLLCRPCGRRLMAETSAGAGLL